MQEAKNAEVERDVLIRLVDVVYRQLGQVAQRDPRQAVLLAAGTALGLRTWGEEAAEAYLGTTLDAVEVDAASKHLAEQEALAARFVEAVN